MWCGYKWGKTIKDYTCWDLYDHGCLPHNRLGGFTGISYKKMYEAEHFTRINKTARNNELTLRRGSTVFA